MSEPKIEKKRSKANDNWRTALVFMSLVGFLAAWLLDKYVLFVPNPTRLMVFLMAIFLPIIGILAIGKFRPSRMRMFNFGYHYSQYKKESKP
ncbi:MAG: hypothetical protein ACI857_001188 [Arenicella sp.]|jgi:hypothetical protein